MRVLFLSFVCLFHQPANATDYPSRAIQIVVATAPGGSIDIVGRLLADQLQKRWNVSVVVANRAGAGGLIAAQTVTRAPPDGYTLLLGNNSHLTIPHFVKTDFDPGKDLSPIAMVVTFPSFFFTSAAMPKSLPEFIEYAKANPGKLNFATVPNSTLFLATFRFIDETGIKATIAFYSSAPQILTALLRSEAQAYIGSPAGMVEQVRAGGIRALAVGGARRNPALPDVPLGKDTSIEHDYESWVSWQAVFAPAGTPKGIVVALSDAIVDVAKQPDMETQFRRNGVEPMPVAWQQFTGIVSRWLQSSRKIAQAAGIRPQ